MLTTLRKSAVFVLLAAMAAWAAPAAAPQDGKTFLANASKAMGADNLKTIQYSGAGTEYAFGQAYSPDSAWPPFVDKSYTRTVNYETPAWRVDRVLADIAPDRRGGGLPPGPTQTQVFGANTPWAAQVDFWMTPQGFLRQAMKNDVSVSSKSMGGKKYSVVTFTAPKPAQ